MTTTERFLFTGYLGNYPARGVVLNSTFGKFTDVQLVFAWTQAPDATLLLGRTNFFAQFDVCFFQSRGYFEVKPIPTP
jgi:hypothetical protein